MTVGINSQFLQKAHLHIVVLSIPHHLAMFWQSKSDDTIVSSLSSVSSPGLILITNVNNLGTKASHLENIMAKNEIFDFDL